MFQQTVGIQMCCYPIITDLFPHAYEADFLQGLLKNKDRKLVQTYNSGFRYRDDVLTPSNS